MADKISLADFLNMYDSVEDGFADGVIPMDIVVNRGEGEIVGLLNQAWLAWDNFDVRMNRLRFALRSAGYEKHGLSD